MRFFLCSLLLFVVLSCTNSKNERHQLIDFVPDDSEIILKTTNLESLKSAIENNSFLNLLSESDTYKGLQAKLNSISNLNPSGDVLICISKKRDSLEYTLITKYSEILFQTDSLKNYIEEELKYKSHSITKSTLEDAVFFNTIVDSTFILSSSKVLINECLNLSDKNSGLKKLYDVTSKDENISILCNTNSKLSPSFFIEDELNAHSLSDFLALDTEISQDNIFINGIAKSIDSSKKVIDLFKNTVPQENQIQNITPGNSDGFLSFTFDDFQVLRENISRYHNKDSIFDNIELFNSIIEVGVIYEDEKRAIVLNSIDAIATQDALLSDKNSIETFRDIKIFEFSKSGIFLETLAPFINNIQPSNYCIIDNYFVFADSVDLLQNIIASYQNKTTLGNRGYFKELSENLSSESSLIFVAKPELLKTIVEKNIGARYNFKNYNLSAIQFIYDTDFAHIHGGLIKGKRKRVQNSISENFNLKLDTDILNTPQFVANHITKQKEIVVQDLNNKLYLISNQGKIVWKKQLNSAILGKVEQIDMYKNGRLQLAFATANRVYVVDRKGRDVAPFPLKFNDAITQPLSVFDYDKNKNYRLLVTQGKNVLMYDARGKTVSGFTFKKANGNIISQPKHFRIGTRDYLVIKTENKLHILDRVGKTRVSPKSTNAYSNEPVFVYKNKFTTTTKDGKLVSVDTRGNVALVDLRLTNNHNLETTSKTRVTFHDNKLGIKSRELELDYGNYTRPNIFYINDKIYVAITDLQSKKVHLYDSQGKMIPNFPVYGNSSISLDNIDRDRNLEFVTKGDANSIILYEIN
ncbi:ribonuclease HII [Hyunsoonleella flava]|uniref:Ribonuclease HII n=1 Tax=Hyunsoonleella flava TaxID=2527939 RepID=A0A4V2J9V9_9FLAO|nr:ribonuclease HII [Hyunsoonleella flava]TBN00836.1 ribonuclease HII [Hyunsoonleella flava]